MTGRARLALALMALLALIAVVYAPVTRGALIGDDHSLVGTNPQVQRGSFMEIFRQPFWAPDPVRDARAAYYRPLAVLSLRTDFAFAGDSAASFHTTNLVLHLIATMVLALVARRFGASTTVALIAAGVWALHPRTTESVAWISGRADVLASLLAIAAIGLWPWYADATMKGGLGVRLRAAAAGLAVLLGLLAKEVAFAAAVAIAAGTWLGAPGTLRERARLVAPRLAYVLVPVLGYGVLRWMAMRSVTWTVTPLGSEARGATILEAIGRYAEMTFDPWHPTTSIGISGDLDRTRAAVGGVVLVACTALVVRALVKRRPAPHRAGAPLAPSVAMVVATALGGSSLALVVHILPIVLASGIAADRLLYLPLASLALGLAVASAKLSPRGRKIAAAVAVALGATFVPVTRARARHYTDELLFRVVAAEQSHPHSTSAKSGLGHVLREDTELDLACRLHASVRRTGS